MKRFSQVGSDTVKQQLEQLLDKKALAALCGVSVRTIDRWVSERRIPYLHLGRRCVRFRWPEVQAAFSRFKIVEIK
jgi:excisionase family DNA binding protein